MDVKFIGVDLETTDLEPEGGAILEVAAVKLDAALNELDRFHAIVPHNLDNLVINDFVTAMHSETGLLGEVQDAQRHLDETFHTALTVQAQLLDWIGEVDKPVLLGSSVQFDRKWMEYHWPEVIAKFHYRNCDVSSIKELISPLEIAEPEVDGKKHRAMYDILKSIGYARTYKHMLETGYAMVGAG